MFEMPDTSYSIDLSLQIERTLNTLNKYENKQTNIENKSKKNALCTPPTTLRYFLLLYATVTAAAGAATCGSCVHPMLFIYNVST